MKIWIFLILTVVLVISEIFLKMEIFGGVALLIFPIVGLFGTFIRKTRKIAVSILIGLIVSIPFVYSRNRILGEIYSLQFRNLFNEYNVKTSGWYFEYSWGHRYGYTHYKILETELDSLKMHNMVLSKISPDKIRSADYVSMFEMNPEKIKNIDIISTNDTNRINKIHGFKKIFEKSNGWKNNDWVLLFEDNGYYDMD